jgi:glycosyltransferase involved in cell wall biosynthesis
MVGDSYFKKFGEINENGNCVLIDPTKKHKQWAQTIKKLVANPEIITRLQDNLHEFAKNNYDIRDWTKKRAEWYKSIIKKTE